MRIRAITLWEPWATLIAIGEKKLETRSWRHGYRGPLAIHAAKRWRAEQREIMLRSPYFGVLSEAGFDLAVDCPFKLGHVVAVADLTAMFSAERALARLQALDDGLPWPAKEIAFGNYRPGRWAWHMENVRRLKKPVAAKGAQGLWYWDVPAGMVRALGLKEK